MEFVLGVQHSMSTAACALQSCDVGQSSVAYGRCCSCVYVCVCVYACVCVCMCVKVCTSQHAYISAHVCVCTNARMSVAFCADQMLLIHSLHICRGCVVTFEYEAQYAGQHVSMSVRVCVY